MQDGEPWSEKVYRVQGIPNDVNSFKDVVQLFTSGLDNVSDDDIHVYSLATALLPRGTPLSSTATVMFRARALPSVTRCSDGEYQWLVRVEGSNRVIELTIDTHFRGMTPLSDVQSSHSFDCIAISGLASHPFGSWQPKGGEKKFMWIRDALPRDIRGMRTIIWGYDSRLRSSRSSQLVPDLAKKFINQLQTYGWGSQSARPMAFLAHSLGGLVLKEALVQLHEISNEGYKDILALMKGAVFFGVPNMGMVQQHLEHLAVNSPNIHLLEDLGRGSSYVTDLSRRFREFRASSLYTELQFFWAYETKWSPTVKIIGDKIDRQGPDFLLVHQRSATNEATASDPSAVFSIDETHSDMVKFTKHSEYYHTVVLKLNTIFGLTHTTNLPSMEVTQSGIDSEELLKTQLGSSVACKSYESVFKHNLEAEFNVFRRETDLTDNEEADFNGTSFAQVREYIQTLEIEQGKSGNLRYLKRLEPFLNSIDGYVRIVEAVGVLDDASSAISFLWGPMQYIIRSATDLWEAFDLVLDAYQKLGVQMQLAWSSLSQLFMSTPHMREVLAMIYKDILSFHQRTIRLFKQRQWKLFFEASWKVFAPAIEILEKNLANYRQLIESQASITEFKAIQECHQSAMNDLQRKIKENDFHRQTTVTTWLCHFDCEGLQQSYNSTRSVCEDPGRWLLNHDLIRDWFSLDPRTERLLWLSGIPGAGKTILASVVIDEARQMKNSTTAFFYCKYEDSSRNSFLAVARSILAQVLFQNPQFLPYFDEKACMSGDTLKSSDIAREILKKTLGSCKRSFLVIDGLDECPPKERKTILRCFSEIEGIRCLYVSQDDGRAGHMLTGLPSIKIGDQNKEDIRNFARIFHKELEHNLRNSSAEHRIGDITNIISARAQGMFIFAEMLVKHLKQQDTPRELLEELDDNKLPESLDDVYERIFRRISQWDNGSLSVQVKLVLGWIVCAQRPLRWREIQGGICIDLDRQHINYDKKLLKSPKQLFSSLVELDPDGHVQLIHKTAHDYLIRTKLVTPLEIHFSLSMLILAYLALPQIDSSLDDDAIATDIKTGFHAFYDYAAACWAIHLEHAISKLGPGDMLDSLLETMEQFIQLHFATSAKYLPTSEKVQAHLSLIKPPELYEKTAQAVEWSRKQLGPHCKSPNEDEALDIWKFTNRLRSVLESMHRPQISKSLPDADARQLDEFYGTNWFKCPRVSCQYYHYGFDSADRRDTHVDRHDRPFLCFFDGCPVKRFGCLSKKDLKRHVFEYHGIDMPGDRDMEEFPKAPKAHKPSTAKNPAKFPCDKCTKQFTQKHNLIAHLRTHAGDKPFACTVCMLRFTRKNDCDRHTQIHGEKKFMCAGELKDGSPWGCRKAFGRAQALADHFSTKEGRKCIEPQILQSRHDKDEEDSMSHILSDQSGPNANALLAAAKLLPSYSEFCRLAGIPESFKMPVVE